MKDIQDVTVKYDLPHAGLLSNGRYSVLVTETGTGYSTFDDYRLTARRSGAEGSFLYLEDLDTGDIWSATFEPVRSRPDVYQARMSPGCFHVRRIDHGIETNLRICVDPASDAEVRRYTLHNRSGRSRSLRITTYSEVALNHPDADVQHPTFSKLFVQTETEAGALIARRRPRSPDERPPLFLQMLPSAPDAAFESDRAAFIGRGRDLRNPTGLTGLKGSVGSVLDPAMSFQVSLELEADAEEELIVISAAGYDRDELLAATAKFRDPAECTRVFDNAMRHEEDVREELSIGPRNGDRYHRVAAGILLGYPKLGASSEVLMSHAEPFTGDTGLKPGLPLIVGRVSESSELPLARLVLKARDFWRRVGMRVQVLLIDDSSDGELEDELRLCIERSRDGSDNVALWVADDVPPDVQRAAQRSARLVVSGERMELLHVPHSSNGESESPMDFPDIDAARPLEQRPEPSTDGLRHFNGFGGFSSDGREYVIHLTADSNGRLRLPPAPWTNVVANEKAGFIVSETGAGYTWVGNSRLNRLTPWHNDPVVDPFGEALYLRDDDSNEIWSPSAGPAGASPVEVRHGFGYSLFRKENHGLIQESLHFVPRTDPLKVVRIRISNTGTVPRRLSAACCVPWVLGAAAEDGRYVVTDYDGESESILAFSPQNMYSGSRPAFASLVVPNVVSGSFTGDLRSFVGRHRTLENPQALLHGGDLNKRVGAGCESGAVFLKSFRLTGGESIDVIFLLGQAESKEAVRDLVEKYSNLVNVEGAMTEVVSYWSDLVSGVQIETPSPAIDLMVNGWLVYQDLSCRIWGRSAFYQSGGAYGYRDQLQDASALTILDPEITRSQILLHAEHQFEEGDVLHWWHPPFSEGIRTRFSDDLLWLPYVTADYVRMTGDASIWVEQVPYMRGAALHPDEDEIFFRPQRSGLAGTLYEHCCRAIDRSLTRGVHGLPLMGSGDWNDGMNRVGRGGKGESVWMGFFLYDILQKFVPVSEGQGDGERAEAYRRFAAELHDAVNTAGWDGQWYRRAYFDDGEVIGSAESDECRIDALAQAWAVISGVASPENATSALDATEQHLISEDDGIIHLLTPPFDKTAKDPGYIKGYLPGVRENGGQYTHAALWTVMALAEAGRCDRAAPLLEMLSPVLRDVSRYKVEPYVIAADVYGVAPHVGRGGWTWYTGSAGWMYRVAIESILGIRLIGGDTLEIAPCIPSTWDGFKVRFRHPVEGSIYHITVTGSGNRVVGAELDGVAIATSEGRARFPTTPGEHRVVVELEVRNKK